MSGFLGGRYRENLWEKVIHKGLLITFPAKILLSAKKDIVYVLN